MLKVYLRDKVVVEEQVGACGQCQQNARDGEEEQGGEIGLDGCWGEGEPDGSESSILLRVSSAVIAWEDLSCTSAR